jgi:hypothetical protein
MISHKMAISLLHVLAHLFIAIGKALTYLSGGSDATKNRRLCCRGCANKRMRLLV